VALTVNDILSQTYTAIYSGGDELILTTAPLAATGEVLALYAGGLVDFESSMPAALHSMGCSAEEIGAALERRRERETAENVVKAAAERTNLAELLAREKLVTTHDAGESKSAPKASTLSTHTPAPASVAGSDD